MTHIEDFQVLDEVAFTPKASTSVGLSAPAFDRSEGMRSSTIRWTNVIAVETAVEVSSRDVREVDPVGEDPSVNSPAQDESLAGAIETRPTSAHRDTLGEETM